MVDDQNQAWRGRTVFDTAHEAWPALLIAALALVVGLAIASPSRAQPQSYYRSATTKCETFPYYFASAATQSMVREGVWVCIEGNRTSFYVDRGGGPNYARELFYHVPIWAGGRPDTIKHSILIEMRPGVAYAYTRGTFLAGAIEPHAGSFETLPMRAWSEAKRTPPFLPTWWSTDPAHDKMLTGLKQIPGYPYPLNPLPWDARILYFQGTTFRRHTDFVSVLAGLDASRDHFSASHALVVYQTPGDAAGAAHMALVPLLPVSQLSRQYSAATGDPMVATFALGNLGVMARLMAPYAAAYGFYKGSGISEQNRQVCAERRAQGVPAAAMPSYCPL